MSFFFSVVIVMCEAISVYWMFASVPCIFCSFYCGSVRVQLSKEKKALDDRVTELSTHLAEEEERSKVAVKQKSKLEALVADLEERLRKEQEVNISLVL